MTQACRLDASTVQSFLVANPSNTEAENVGVRMRQRYQLLGWGILKLARINIRVSELARFTSINSFLDSVPFPSESAFWKRMAIRSTSRSSIASSEIGEISSSWVWTSRRSRENAE